MERSLQEYNCPECGIYAGTAHSCVIPQFYCCGKRFPVRPELDTLALADDMSVPLVDKERMLRGFIKQTKHRKVKTDIKLTNAINQAESLYKRVVSQMEGVAVLKSDSKHKPTMSAIDRRTQITMWHLLLSHHASQNSNPPPKRSTYDDCVRYAKKHEQPLPEWAS